MAEFIYQMYQARKAHGDKVILDDVTLSFYPGAKIGVVGPNGMGKSTLLKIMAGIEEVSNGDARLTPGYTVGILQQEPPLDDDKTVIENVRMAFGGMIAKVDRFNKIGEEMCDPDCDMDALMAERDRAVSEMRRLNDSIEDAKISRQIDHMERVTQKIFAHVAENPKKLPQIRRFLNYYLPTTLKLLNAYDRMDDAGVAGANIDGTMGKIEAMLDTVVLAYDKQLDALFADEALDISTDITVMEQMLSQEGLGGTQLGR